MRIALCDLNRYHAELLYKCMDIYRNINPDVVYTEFINPSSLLACLENGKIFDLILVDLDFEHFNVIEVMQNIKSIDRNVLYIFASKSTDRITEALEAEPYQILLKPLQEDVVARQLSRAMMKIYKKWSWFTSKADADTLILRIDHILYIEAQNKEINVHYFDVGNPVENSSFAAKGKISVEEKRYQKYGLFRIHRGYLLNTKHVKKLGHDFVEITNGERLLVSKSRRKGFVEYVMSSLHEIYY